MSEFIAFVTSEAADKCKSEKRKTINGRDIINSMEALGFEAYLPGLNEFLRKHEACHKGEAGEESKLEDVG